MTRLIDADKLPNIYTATHQEMIMSFEEAPTVDAVPVIRCKDCQWFLPNEEKSRGWCSFSQHGYPNADDYCSDAVRKEE